jgi:hypothetical protein
MRTPLFSVYATIVAVVKDLRATKTISHDGHQKSPRYSLVVEQSACRVAARQLGSIGFDNRVIVHFSSDEVTEVKNLPSH